MKRRKEEALKEGKGRREGEKGRRREMRNEKRERRDERLERRNERRERREGERELTSCDHFLRVCQWARGECVTEIDKGTLARAVCHAVAGGGERGGWR